jgi:predicted MFS family arabinose efflux permease
MPADFDSIHPANATMAALSANLVGIGLARFGYTPLIPALIAAGWFAPAAAVYLGAANLAGYLAGALGARAVAGRGGPVTVLRTMMALAAGSLLACALPFGFGWFFVWRFLSGLSGGVLMALAAPSVLPHIPPARRGLASGAIFTGVGLGIAASGTVVPLLLRIGLAEAWLGLGAIGLVLTAVAWNGWPREATAAQTAPRGSARPTGLSLPALYLEYALNAVGLVPHMIFLVDFIARGLGQGLGAGALYWIVFGLGALCGPVAGGYIGDRLGFATTLRLAFVIEAACVALPLISTGAPALTLSSFVVGAFVPGIVAITIGRTHELIPGDPRAQSAAWAYCTTAFALGQAIAGYGFSYIFARVQHSYPTLFALATGAMLLALAVDIFATAVDKTALKRL